MTAPLCKCHGESSHWAVDKSAKNGGWWTCAVKRRASWRRFASSDKGRAVESQRAGSSKRRASTARYQQSAKGRAAALRYRLSDKGRAKQRRNDVQRRFREREVLIQRYKEASGTLR